MMADMRIASTAARFHPGYARAGTSPDCGLSWTLPQAIGRERAMRFFLEQGRLPWWSPVDTLAALESAVLALDDAGLGDLMGVVAPALRRLRAARRLVLQLEPAVAHRLAVALHVAAATAARLGQPEQRAAPGQMVVLPERSALGNSFTVTCLVTWSV